MAILLKTSLMFFPDSRAPVVRMDPILHSLSFCDKKMSKSISNFFLTMKLLCRK